MQTLETTADLDAALASPVAVLLKYSTTCPISANARRELQAFEARHPDQPVYGVDVHRARALSDEIADRLDVPHESPQTLVLRDGAVVSTTTHWDVSAADLEQTLAMR